GSLSANGPGVHPPLEVTFLGRSEQRYRLLAEIEQRGLGQVVREGGQIGYGQVLRRLVEADILLLMDTPGRRVGVPAKLYEYLGARRPILALTEPDGDVANVLAQSGVPYRIAAPSEPGRIRQALAELVAEVAADRDGCTAPDALGRFTRENTAR